MSDFVITGMVRDEGSGEGLEGLIVRPYDKEHLYDDLMGDCKTACDGSFRFKSKARDLKDLLEKRPDIYLKIYPQSADKADPAEIYKTSNPVQWNANKLLYMVVDIPQSITNDLPSDSLHHKDDHERNPNDHDYQCHHQHHKKRKCSPITKSRNIYLKIEKLPAYSPVAPDDEEHDVYRRDCMRNTDHEDSYIPAGEVERRRMDAIVYREYLDCECTVLKNDPIITADINEPRAERRIPGAVLYAAPGERLFVHVCNADDQPHTFHVHGLIYGIDSDGSWPFGVEDHHDRRSDAICPGQTWCYIFDVTEDTIGAWPFHDHHMHIMEAVNRGLFGGIIVRNPECPKADYEVPIFLHKLTPKQGPPGFDSGSLIRGETFTHIFTEEGTFNYHCQFHPMYGIVRVTATGPLTAIITILDSPGRFDSADITVQTGATVTWLHAGNQPHTVTDTGGDALESYSLNGRTFIGNTPTIVAKTGKRIRWYVFNLDLSSEWHNFHVHGQRFRVGEENMDTRTIGPAESFVVDTIVPPVILLPLEKDCKDHQKHRHDHEDCGCSKSLGPKLTQIPTKIGTGGIGHTGHGAGAILPIAETAGHGHEHSRDTREKQQDHPEHEKNRKLKLQGDFLFHCHVEMHMMHGMAGIVRAIQQVKVFDKMEKCLGFNLPLATGDGCPDVTLHPCGNSMMGTWETLPDAPIFIVHAAVLRSGKVLLWSGTAEVGDPLESRVWDPGTGTMTSQTYTVDLFCSGHAFMADGRLCIAGGAPSGTLRATHIFDPIAETWTRVRDMNQARWYPTVLTLPDGRILAASGTGANELEIYDPGADTWQIVSGATRTFSELYPSLHMLPSGQIFYSRVGWAQANMTLTQTAYLSLTGTTSGTWTDLGQQQFPDRQEGMSVIQIDTTQTPVSTKIFVMGGGVSAPATERNPLTSETINVSTLSPGLTWTRTADMNFPRVNVNGVLLPDGTILVIGGQRNGKWNSDPGAVLETEIYDPSTNTWYIAGSMQFPRQYHSIAVLLPDGRVLAAGGVDPRPTTIQRDQRNMEIFSPAYLSMGTPPTISTAPGTITWEINFNIDSPASSSIESVVLIRPASVTHHTDAGQRYIKIPIVSRTASSLTVKAPVDANIAPPGYYMLFIINTDRIPSIAKFINMG